MEGLRKNLFQPLILVVGSVTLLCILATAALSQSQPAATSAASGASTAGGTYTPNPRAVSLYNLGLTAHKQGSPESAIIFFRRACDIDPNLADAQYNLGVLFQMQKRYKEAIPRFEEVLRIKPTDPDAHFQLGIILQDTGRLPEARQQLSSIAPNSSHFPEAQRRIAQLNSGPNPAVPQDSQQTQPYQVPQSSTLRDPPSNPYMDPSGPAQQQQMQQNVQMQTDTTLPLSKQPATAYVPPNTEQPPSSAGPVPSIPNSTLRIIATGFSAPTGLAFDRNGSLYVANYLSNSIDRIGSDGSRAQFCKANNLRGPVGLVADDSNNLYVANYNGGTIVRISPAGISNVIATGFKKPYYLTLDRDGNLYVSQAEDMTIVRIVLPRTLGARTR